jgi:aerobic C4-dicarboxylate transport protein
LRDFSERIVYPSVLAKGRGVETRPSGQSKRRQCRRSNRPLPRASRATQAVLSHLYFQVLLAIVMGGAIGHFYPEIGQSLKPLGDAFIKLVKMVIAPVIFLTVVTGIAGMRDLDKVGRVAIKALLYFLVFSTLALIVGLIVANVVQPGAGMNIDPATLKTDKIAEYAAKAHDQTIVGFLMNIIPTPWSAPSPRARSCRCC